jgi:hypothetical protein
VIEAVASRPGSGLPNVRAKPGVSRTFGPARLGLLGPGFARLTAFCRAEHSTTGITGDTIELSQHYRVFEGITGDSSAVTYSMSQ